MDIPQKYEKHILWTSFQREYLRRIKCRRRRNNCLIITRFPKKSSKFTFLSKKSSKHTITKKEVSNCRTSISCLSTSLVARIWRRSLWPRTESSRTIRWPQSTVMILIRGVLASLIICRAARTTSSTVSKPTRPRRRNSGCSNAGGRRRTQMEHHQLSHVAKFWTDLCTFSTIWEFIHRKSHTNASSAAHPSLSKETWISTTWCTPAWNHSHALIVQSSS